MRHFRNVGLAVLLLAMGASTSLAQRSTNTGAGAGSGGGYWEFGLDFVGLNFGLEDPSTTTLGFGSGTVRGGRFLTDVISLEPAVTFVYGSTSGVGSGSIFALELGLLYHLQSDRKTQQWYVRPLILFSRTASNPSGAGASTSDNRTGFGIGFGVKKPSKKNAKFTWRAEATYASMSKPTESALNIGGGISIFTK